MNPSALAIVLASLVMSGVAAADEPLDPFAGLSGEARAVEVKPLTFSSTQRWKKAFLVETKVKLRMLPENWETGITLPSPPANRSDRTAAELAYLLELQAKRTPEEVAAIQKEAVFGAMRFGKYRAMDLIDVKRLPKTAALVDAGMKDIDSVMFRLKLKFDRVRPSFLETRLKPVMNVPGHPAYPSGHATQAFFLAHLLAELDPPNRDKYLADAAAIAKHREIAGFHYPSDSAAGASLARQVLDQFLRQAAFKELLEKARDEWKPDRPAF